VRDRGLNILALTVPAVLLLTIVGAAWRDRTLDPVISGGIIAILSGIIGLFAAGGNKEEK